MAQPQLRRHLLGKIEQKSLSTEVAGSVNLDVVLETMHLPDLTTPTKLYRHALPIDLIDLIDALRARHRDQPEITLYRRNTVRFALELLLALEGAIF